MMALSQRSQGLGPAQLKGPNLQSSQVGTSVGIMLFAYFLCLLLLHYYCCQLSYLLILKARICVKTQELFRPPN